MSLQAQNWDIIQMFGLGVLNCHIKGTENVAIYAFSSGKFLDARKFAGVKDLTNIMSGCIAFFMSCTPYTLITTLCLWHSTDNLS